MIEPNDELLKVRKKFFKRYLIHEKLLIIQSYLRKGHTHAQYKVFCMYLYTFLNDKRKPGRKYSNQIGNNQILIAFVFGS